MLGVITIIRRQRCDHLRPDTCTGRIVSTLRHSTRDDDRKHWYSPRRAPTWLSMIRRLLLINALIFGLLLSAGSARAQTYEVLHSFTGNAGSGFNGDTDGANPEAPLIQGPDGYFYGTTVGGSAIDTCYLGTVFKMSPSGNMEILHYFRLNAGDDGRSPKAGLFIGSDGRLYGTTPLSTSLCGGSEYGTVFRLSTSGAFSQLHLFLG